MTANITFEGDTFTSEKIPKVNIPIFLNGDKNNVVVLPLTETTFQKVTLSAADNCIGQFNLAALEADGCGEDQSTCLKWKTNASLGGYITLEEADNVNVKDLGQSLCVLLTGTAAQKTAEGKCPRNPDNTITPRGDYCSTSKQAEDCKDSFWLSATFAASAVRIHDGASVPECVPQAP